MSLTPLNWFIAVFPLLVVLILMTGFKWGGTRTGPVGLGVAAVIAAAFFGAGGRLLLYSQVRGFFLSLHILLIVWMSLLLYNTADRAGAIEAIGKSIVDLTGDRILQLLVLGWVFSSFLQGVGGFGVPVAIVAPLLIGAGFAPMVAVVAVSIGHAWAVTFGSIASSFNALIATTGMPGHEIAFWPAAMLGMCAYLCGLAVAHLYGGFSSVRHSLLAVAVIGSVMAFTQLLLATNGLWNMAGFGAGMAGLVASLLVSRLPPYRNDAPKSGGRDAPGMSPWLAVSAYLILVVIIVSAQLIGPLNELLDSVMLGARIPETSTSLGWVNPAANSFRISLFGHPGSLLLYTCVIAYLIYRSRGLYAGKNDVLKVIAKKTLKSSARSSIGILTMVGMAMVMTDSGMTNLVALGLSSVSAEIFPLLSPFIGLIGSFMTGSNTNSNVLFADLQIQTAKMMSLSVTVMLGAQTAGGAIGSNIAPAKVIVGCSTAGLSGREGEVMRKMLLYMLAITAAIGVVAWLVTRAG